MLETRKIHNHNKMSSGNGRINWQQVKNSRDVLVKNLNEQQSYEVTICNRNYIVLPGVFSPKYFGSTQIFSSHIPFQYGEKFLEIGCGTGITSVEAALAGAQRVVAVDISAAAVENTRLNAQRFSVDSILDSRQSNIFSSIGEDEKFNSIYWNLPFIYVSSDFELQSAEEMCLFDPGYKITEKFLKESHNHLSANGRLFIGFGDFGDENLLLSLCSKTGWVLREIVREESYENATVEFILFEALPVK
jgi:release factor glutamine methyltransferase